MKKILPLLLAALLLGGCGSQEHTHTPLEGWERDGREHWQLCECGERMNVAAHNLVSDVCVTCYSEVWTYDDDSVLVYNYDDNGMVVRASCYNAQGGVDSDVSYVYELFPDGGVRREESYENGFLVQEMEYDENYNLLFSRFYEEGKGLTQEYLYEYALDEDGWWYQIRGQERDVLGGVTYAYEYNVQSDIVSRVKYDGDNNVVYTEQYERQYNEENQPLWEKTYINSVLTREITGYMTITDSDGWMRFPEEIIEYYEDGAKLVSRYGDNGEVATEQYILPDGTVARDLRYEYQTDVDGNRNYMRVYNGDRLATESRYETTEDGWTYCATLIDYRSDGSKKVFHYDENETLIEEIEYDTNGERIPG